MLDRLYEHIGGGKTVNKLVQVFYDKALADERLSPFFRQTDMANLRARQAMFLTMLLGGSRTFSGIDLATAHASARQRGMNDETFDALLVHFRESLMEINVAQDYIDEVMALLENTRDRVLGR